MLTHGKASSYNQGCRCLRCTKANTKRARDRRARLRASRVVVDGRPVSAFAEHGTLNGYGNWQCRCRPCTKAHTDNLLKRRREQRERISQ